MILFLTALSVFLVWLAFTITGYRGARRIPFLRDVETLPAAELPRLSVVVPARNEEATVERCLRSLAEQDYPDLEIIAVNDRSTDRTGELAERVAASAQGQIVVEHVQELPEGWLGKCNALARGASRASGDYILFTDGDVIFERDSLRLAVSHAVRENADMVVVFPEMLTHSALEHALVMAFVHTLSMAMEPWRAMDRRSHRFIGVGAFNMVRRSLYEKIGGHRFLRLQVIDDLGLGKLIKYAGGLVRVLYGTGHVVIRWQHSIAGHVRGLEKNAFPAMGYRTSRAIVAVCGLLFVYLWPWIGIFVGPLSARVLCAITALALQPGAGFAGRRFGRFHPLYGYLHVLGALLFSWAVARSTWLALRRGAIVWRDTSYPLSELRKFRL